MDNKAMHHAVYAAHPVTSAPTISVVTPSFNQSDYIESTLRSVITQGYPQLQYVVIDGASNDGSAEIIGRHAESLHYWVSEPDRGHADALNKGFAHTSGDIMCWINSSDIHYPWTLDTVADIFSELPQVEWLTGVPTELGHSGGPKLVGGIAHNAYDFLAGDYRWIQQESVFWRRSLWERAGGRLDASLRYAADFDLWLRFFSLAKLYHVPTVLGGFRVHGDRLGARVNYVPEAARLMSRYVDRQDRRTLRRVKVIRAVGDRFGQKYQLERVARKLSLCPWYRHARVEYDFSEGRWRVR